MNKHDYPTFGSGNDFGVQKQTKLTFIPTTNFMPSDEPIKKRTVVDQINFNFDLIVILEKEILTLNDKLLPYMQIVPVAENNEKSFVQDSDCEVLKILDRQNEYLIKLIKTVQALKINLQL